MRVPTLLLALSLGACGGPALQNVPQPNPAVVAGMAAALAGAATLADPHGATHKPERQDEPNLDGVEVKESVPAGVLDRLDKQPPAKAAPKPAAPPLAPTPPPSPAAPGAPRPQLWPPPTN
jgi:hypothetical protein